MKRQGLLSASGILLLGLIVLMTLHEWDNPLEEDREAFLNAPMIIADRIVAKAYDEEDGRVQYRLVANHLEQYERDALTTLTEPVLRMDNSNGLWTIQSRHGEVRDNGDLIVFTDQVEARSESNGVTLDTEELQYHNDTNRVVSPGELAMRHRDGRTRAGAMESDLTSGEMTLKQGVVSEFTGSTE